MNKRILTIILILLICIDSGCSKMESENIDAKFIEKTAVEKGKDGWVYYMSLSYDLDDKGNYDKNKIDVYTFDAMNLKYKHMDGYYIPVQDADTNELIDKIEPGFPDLIYHDDTRDDMNKISDCFTKNHYTKEIKADDLNVDLTHFTDKELVARLFNKALKQKDRKMGVFRTISSANVVQTNKINGKYKWQIGYIVPYGHLDYVDIELIYNDNQYLSDLVEKGTATNEQKELQEAIENIEKKMVSEQKLSTLEYSKKTIANINFARLESLCKRILDGKE